MSSKTVSGTRMLTFSLFISIIHHIDHILRIDHSGWPFIQPLSPMTYSLIVYPIFLSIYLARFGSLYRIFGSLFLFIASTGAHIFFEPLRDKYHTWTFGSDLKYHVGEMNMLGIRSPVLGVLSILIAIALSVFTCLTFLRFIRERKQAHGHLTS